MSSQPIRIGLIGLGRQTGHNVPGLWAMMAHLPFLLSSPKYQITAVANSTTASAQAAIDHHNLGPNVKAYGNPTDLAQDPNVDMVVVSVKVGAHYALSKPALLAGKSLFVEWPLGASLSEAQELATLAATHGSKTVVGVQARASPLVLKIKELVTSGKIGKVLSSTVISSFGGLPAAQWPQGAEYYLDMNSGGNQFTIFFGHFLDTFTHVLGDFASLTSSMRCDYPSIDIVDSAGTVVQKGYQKTSPDHVQVSGKLVSGANASIVFYTAPGEAVDGVGVRWVITGTEGQMEIITQERQWQMGAPGTKLRARLGRGAGIVEVNFEDVEEEKEVREAAFPGTNTARLYDAFAEEKRDVYADFESAVKTHALLEWIKREAGW
ncbi:putative oxidoreductase [Mollisia scopiformis]|uniref:Putative oxidoreductase n=1 Tax=Mollisia scopiformis TaxID=149040 RepID=A0A194XWD6_MOLSC|nr:putative oxidoreductase [Mollisia scopiformis]KUJ24334.1 putative oxidoreductase [Mollisia scopiformis]